MFEKYRASFHIPDLSHATKWLFWFVLLGVLFVSALNVKAQVLLVLDSRKPEKTEVKQEGVRIDFKSYDAVMAKKSAVKNFTSTLSSPQDPFGLR